MMHAWIDEEIRLKFLEHGWSEAAAQFFVLRKHELRAQKIIARMFGVKIRFPSPSDFTKQSISKDLRWEIFERDDFTCQHCGARRNLTVDHKHPEHLGGTSEQDNLQTLCSLCNSSKGHRLIEQ